MASPTSMLEESPALKFRNLSLIELLHEYFEYVWRSAGEKELNF